jgi:predicted nucleic acid-binding Zn ribbon protein
MDNKKYENSNFQNRSEGKSLGDVLKNIVNQYGIGEKLVEAKIVSDWEKIVGKMIARHTTKLFIKKNKLFIQIDSAPLKNEISYAKSKLLEAIQNETNSKLIEEIILL